MTAPDGQPLDVLVVGAGPTGLAAALIAHDHGAHVRIVDRRPDAPRFSRAFLVQSRTLEVLRPHGVTDELLALGDSNPQVHLHLRRRCVPVHVGEIRLPDTAFPNFLLVRQATWKPFCDEHSAAVASRWSGRRSTSPSGQSTESSAM